MKIINGFPPNYIQIKKHLNPDENTIFCYGDAIYNPTNKKITPDLEEHEKVHMKQQGAFPDLWWDKYLVDPAFRLEQELEAYGAQYIFIKEVIGAKGSLLQWFLDNMALALSSDIYGRIITHGEASSKIRNYGKKQPI